MLVQNTHTSKAINIIHTMTILLIYAVADLMGLSDLVQGYSNKIGTVMTYWCDNLVRTWLYAVVSELGQYCNNLIFSSSFSKC